MAFTITYKNLDAATEKFFIPKLIDNFFLSSPLLYKLKQNEDTFDGGERIMQPISYTNHPNAGAWPGKAGTLRTTYIEHMTSAEFFYSHYYCDVTLPETELLKNGGSGTKVIDILKAQMELAEETLKDTMGVDIYSDGAVASDGSRKLNGLQSMINAGTDPSFGSYGGITRSGASGSKIAPVGNAFWNSNPMAIDAGSTVRWRGTFTNGGAGTALTLAKMETMFLLCSANNECPDLIVTHPTLFGSFWALQQAIQRQASENEMGRVGFKYLLFNGVPVVADDNIDASTKMYFLNTKHIFLRPHKDSNFARTPFQSLPNQRMKVKFIYWDGQITTDRPNLQGVITGILS